MIRDTINTINSLIAEQLPSSAVQIAGIAAPFHDQAEAGIGLNLNIEQRFSLDDRLIWQSMHLTDRLTLGRQRTFGSFTDTLYKPGLILIGVSKNEYWFDLAIAALKATSYVVIDTYEIETLNVLTRYFRTKFGQDKNYDPALFAFAIRYHIEGVSEEDLYDLTLVDSALLIDNILYEFDPVKPEQLVENLFPYFGETANSVTIGPNPTSTFVDNEIGFPSVIITTIP